MFSERALRFAIKYNVKDFTFACSLLCKIVAGTAGTRRTCERFEVYERSLLRVFVDTHARKTAGNISHTESDVKPGRKELAKL